jgi:hypothetical protein
MSPLAITEATPTATTAVVDDNAIAPMPNTLTMSATCFERLGGLDGLAKRAKQEQEQPI